MSPYVCTIYTKQANSRIVSRKKRSHLGPSLNRLMFTRCLQIYIGNTRGSGKQKAGGANVFTRYRYINLLIRALFSSVKYTALKIHAQNMGCSMWCDAVAGDIQVIYKWFTRYLQVINNQVIFKWFTSELPLTEWLTFRSVRIIRNWK